MLAIGPPVISRKAVTSSSLWKQNPVSSVAVTVPGKARLKRETFTTTRLPTSLALNEGESGGGIVSHNASTLRLQPRTPTEQAPISIWRDAGNRPRGRSQPAKNLIA